MIAFFAKLISLLIDINVQLKKFFQYIHFHHDMNIRFDFVKLFIRLFIGCFPNANY